MPKRPKSSTKSNPSNTVRATKTKPVPSKPGYMAFSKEVWRVLVEHRQVVIRLWLLATVTLLIVVGSTEIDQYDTLSGATDEAVTTVGDATARFGIATGVLLSSLLGGTVASSLSETQQVSRTALYVFLWLAVVWMMRHIFAGTAIKLRDALYNAGAPLLSSLLIAGIGVVQLLPVALVAAFFAALLGTGALNAALVSIAMIIIVVLLSVVTIYWLTTTIMALMIVTIPGTYPLAAYRSAKALVAGKRRELLMRVLWLVATGFMAYMVFMLPWLLLDAGSSLPLGFVVVSLSNSLAIALAIYATTYLYMLYRRLIDERAD